MDTAVARPFHCCSELLAAITVGSGADDASMLSRAGCRTGIRRDSGAGYLPVECRRIPWNRQLARYEPAVSGETIPNLPSSRQVNRFAARRIRNTGPTSHFQAHAIRKNGRPHRSVPKADVSSSCGAGALARVVLTLILT